MARNKFMPAGLMLLVAVICVWRMPSRFQKGFLWAEDAPIFVKQAIEHGPSSLYEQYAGYLHLIARMIASVGTSIMPLTALPYALPWTCVVLYGLMAAYVQRTVYRFASVESQRIALPASLIAALIPFLAPQNGEIYLSVTNLQWFIAPALLLCIFETMTKSGELTPRQTMARIAFIVAATLTGPFGVIFMPAVAALALYRRWKGDRTTTAWPMLAAYLVAVAVQIYFIRTNPEVSSVRMSPLSFPWAKLFAERFVLDTFLPAANSAGAMRYAVIAALCFALAVCMWGRWWSIKAALFALAVGLWAVGVLRSGTVTTEITWAGSGSRYFFIPHIFMIWALLIAVCSGRGMWQRGIGVALIGALLTASFGSFRLRSWENDDWAVQKTAPNEYVLKVAPSPWQTTIRYKWNVRD